MTKIPGQFIMIKLMPKQCGFLHKKLCVMLIFFVQKFLNFFPKRKSYAFISRLKIMCFTTSGEGYVRFKHFTKIWTVDQST